MATSHALLQRLCSWALFLTLVSALKFDIEAFHQGDARATRCIRNFVAKDTLVVVTATVDGTKGDGQVLNMHVSFTLGRFRVCEVWSVADKYDRLKIPWAMTTVDPRMLLESSVWSLLRTQMHRLTSVSKTT